MILGISHLSGKLNVFEDQRIKAHCHMWCNTLVTLTTLSKVCQNMNINEQFLTNQIWPKRWIFNCTLGLALKKLIEYRGKNHTHFWGRSFKLVLIKLLGIWAQDSSYFDAQILEAPHNYKNEPSLNKSWWLSETHNFFNSKATVLQQNQAA